MTNTFPAGKSADIEGLTITLPADHGLLDDVRTLVNSAGTWGQDAAVLLHAGTVDLIALRLFANTLTDIAEDFDGAVDELFSRVTAT